MTRIIAFLRSSRQPGTQFLVKFLLKLGCCSRTSLVALLAAFILWPDTALASSFYPVRPSDSCAVDFTAEAFGAHADGISDDSDALRRAVDHVTKRTAPVWQFLLMDSSFEGQRAAAIKTQEAGFTLIRVNFLNMQVALQIAPGEVEQLYGRELRMTNIRSAAFIAGNARNANARTSLYSIHMNFAGR